MKRLILSIGIAMLAGLSLTSCVSYAETGEVWDGTCCCTDKGMDCEGDCGCACDRCPSI